ncbi:MAG: DUF1996 domain-containing protein [Actinomycetota bacterium]
MKLRSGAGAAVLVLALGGIPSVVASAQTTHGWIDTCRLSHSVRSGPGSLNGDRDLHDFLGGDDASGRSTLRSMRRGGTTCQRSDTASYWAPALFENGRRVRPSGKHVREQVYYRDDNLRRHTVVRAFPPGMELVAGNSEARSTAGNQTLGTELYWGCSDDTPGGHKHTHPISCRTGIISLHIGLPNCWDGVHRSMPDHPDAVVYPHAGTCPSSNPVALPRVIERWEYPVGPVTGHISLSNGPAYRVYGGLWNTWKQGALRHLVASCLNGDKNCGTFKPSGTRWASQGRPAKRP